MKKAKILSALTLSATVLLVGSTVFAAPIPPETTTGTVKFEPETGSGNIIEPDPGTGEDEIIKVPGGKTGSGIIRIQFVPNFDFGTHGAVTAAAADIPVKLLAMNDKDNAPKGVIAPFVQITDGRGLKGEDPEAQWRLDASATQFVDKNNALNTLGDSYISIDGSTLTTTNEDQDFAKGMVTGLAGSKNKLSADENNPTKIMSTIPGKTTGGFQVSNVFHNAYTKGMEYPVAGDNSQYPKGERTDGVTFHKADKVVPQAGVDYVSTVTWTLTVGP